MASLTSSQLTRLAAMLDARYSLLLATIRNDLEKSDQHQNADVTERMPADAGDQASDSSEVDLNLAIIDRHLHELADLEAAKLRIKEQGFGSCLDCGDEIGIERLLAYPTAMRCLVCQTKRERTYAGDVHPPV